MLARPLTRSTFTKPRRPDGLLGRVLKAFADQLASVFLYSLFTHDCMAKHETNTIIKFSDDTIVVGLITENNHTTYCEEVRDLAAWCQDNNLSLSVS
jgi:hypothetical protein